MTLAELKTLIQNFCESTETTFVASLDDFIKSSEDRIFELVQSDYFKKVVAGNVTAGNRFLTCPTDFILSFSLAVVDSSSDYHYLLKKHSSFMQEYNKDVSDTNLRGLPKYYADQDKELSSGSNSGSTLLIAPVPDANYSVELTYLHKPNSLVTDTTGTWLSTNARNVLLYGSLVEAYTFLKGEQDLLQLYENRFVQEIERLKNRAEARGRRDEYRYDALRSPTT
jgi:hypothetical protein